MRPSGRGNSDPLGLVPLPRLYEIRSRIRAPLPFVFQWCTDYTPEDGRFARETYRRRILRRTARRVTFEDVEEAPKGWMWRRTTVALHPPDHWHAESVGNYRRFLLDYRLRALPNGETELTLRGKRWATRFAGRNPPKKQLERYLRTLWANLGRALEREYRAKQGGGRNPVRNRRPT